MIAAFFRAGQAHPFAQGFEQRFRRRRHAVAGADGHRPLLPVDANLNLIVHYIYLFLHIETIEYWNFKAIQGFREGSGATGIANVQLLQ